MAKEPTENVSISMPMNLLQILDHICCTDDLTRSQAVNRAVRLWIGSKLIKDPAFWDREYTRLQSEGKLQEL